MKILYAIQGTGNGHISRAREIIPILQKDHEVDLLISGTQADVELPYEIKYRFNGLSFIFGKKGGVDLFETYKKSKIRKLLKEINSLPVNDYDLVLNDFEPVSAWACYLKSKPCISVSHQAAVLDKNAPQPTKSDLVGKAILQKYAPVTAKYGFHFAAYSDHIFTPVIRSEVRKKVPVNKGHYTVYLPAYSDDRIIKVLKECGDKRWEVFSKHNKKEINYKNISIKPINNEAFIESMVSAEGVLCGAGFETPAEALFLRKKLLVIPMKAQYEQQCNAAALKSMGVPVIKSLKKKHCDTITRWLKSKEKVEVNYPDKTEEILHQIIKEHSEKTPVAQMVLHRRVTDDTKFRQVMLKKIIARL